MLDHRPASDAQVQGHVSLDQRLRLERTLNLQARENAIREATDDNRRHQDLNAQDLTDLPELEIDRRRYAFAVERQDI